MSHKRDALIFGEIEKGDFCVSACDENVSIELVDVDDISVLVGVKLVGVLICFVALVVAVLQNEAIREAAKESVLEGLDLV